jgi:hypothetical protein
MKSPGLHNSASRAELTERVATVMQAARVIRSELALTICESSEMRISSRQLRLDSARTTRGSSVWRQRLVARKAQRQRWIAHAIVQIPGKPGLCCLCGGAVWRYASIQ